MIQRYLLDTNMVSYLIKGESPAARHRLATLGPDEVACISSITEAELWYGLAKRPQPAGRHASVVWFLSRLSILPWGSQEARTYGSLRARQEALGKTLAALDLLIATHAVSSSAILVTRDQAFHQIADLPGVENWATDL